MRPEAFHPHDNASAGADGCMVLKYLVTISRWCCSIVSWMTLRGGSRTENPRSTSRSISIQVGLNAFIFHVFTPLTKGEHSIEATPNSGIVPRSVPHADCQSLLRSLDLQDEANKANHVALHLHRSREPSGNGKSRNLFIKSGTSRNDI